MSNRQSGSERAIRVAILASPIIKHGVRKLIPKPTYEEVLNEDDIVASPLCLNVALRRREFDILIVEFFGAKSELERNCTEILQEPILRDGDYRIVLITKHDDPYLKGKAAAIGIKCVIPEELLDQANLEKALIVAKKGGFFVAGKSALTQQIPALAEGCYLTPREIQVLEKLSLGLKNKQIATALHISYETVKEHVQHVLIKLGVSDRTQAAVWAARRGLV